MINCKQTAEALRAVLASLTPEQLEDVVGGTVVVQAADELRQELVRDGTEINNLRLNLAGARTVLLNTERERDDARRQLAAAVSEAKRSLAAVQRERDDFAGALTICLEEVDRLRKDRNAVLENQNQHQPVATPEVEVMCFERDDARRWGSEAVRSRDEARRQVEQLQVQLAECAVAAAGGTSPAVVAKQGEYGWSPAYQAVLDLRRQFEVMLLERDEACRDADARIPAILNATIERDVARRERDEADKRVKQLVEELREETQRCRELEEALLLERASVHADRARADELAAELESSATERTELEAELDDTRLKLDEALHGQAPREYPLDSGSRWDGDDVVDGAGMRLSRCVGLLKVDLDSETVYVHPRGALALIAKHWPELLRGGR